jgi:hypothetical protein
MEVPPRLKLTSILVVPTSRDFPLKHSLYTINRTRRRTPRQPQPTTEPLQPIQPKETKTVKKRVKELSSDAIQLLKDKYSHSFADFTPQPEPAKPKSDLERIVRQQPKRPRHDKAINKSALMLSSLTEETDKTSSGTLDTSNTLSSSRVFTFFDVVLADQTPTSLTRTKRVREVVNLPKLPYGRHFNIEAKSFAKDHIKETETELWYNINHSKRRSPRDKRSS